MSIEQSETAAGVDEIVRVRREGDVTVVTMNYPERRNAFSMKMRLALTEVFQRLMNDDPDTRAIVLTGAGGHFCAGGDLSEMHASTPSLLAFTTLSFRASMVFRSSSSPFTLMPWSAKWWPACS